MLNTSSQVIQRKVENYVEIWLMYKIERGKKERWDPPSSSTPDISQSNKYIKNYKSPSVEYLENQTLLFTSQMHLNSVLKQTKK